MFRVLPVIWREYWLFGAAVVKLQILP